VSTYKVRIPEVKNSWYLPGILVGLGFTFKKMIQKLGEQKTNANIELPRREVSILLAF
jgi:hypothetical protein